MQKRNRFKILENPIDLNQRILGSVLKSGDCVVDATCGNGHDSVFLAQCIGQTGTLYGFDLQEIAIQNTKRNLEKLSELPTLHLHHASHEDFSPYVTEPIDCIMYNLGYLPSSDKTITTQPQTTIASLKSAFSILKPHGMISIMIYREHDQEHEYQQLKGFFATLDSHKFNIAEINFALRKTAPILYLIEKQ